MARCMVSAPLSTSRPNAGADGGGGSGGLILPVGGRLEPDADIYQRPETDVLLNDNINSSDFCHA